MMKILLVLFLLLTGCNSSWERIFVDVDSSSKNYGVWLSYVDLNEMLNFVNSDNLCAFKRVNT